MAGCQGGRSVFLFKVYSRIAFCFFGLSFLCFFVCLFFVFFCLLFLFFGLVLFVFLGTTTQKNKRK